MSAIPAELRRLVILRAQNRCEYCGLSQESQEATFHIDHIHPVIVGGSASAENLALACVSCSLRKGARETAIDPQTGNSAALFHPRLDVWQAHFRWQGEQMIGLTSVGRATVEALNMNRPAILAIRREETLRGRHPYPPPFTAQA